jgi:hypothetical protein
MTVQALIVQNEDEAFDLLGKYLRDELPQNVSNVEFQGWPVLQVRIVGPGYDSSITAEVAEAIVALQKALNRAYARLVRDEATLRHLTDAEKNKLAIRAEVKPGSSLINVNLDEVAKQIGLAMVDKMDPNQIIGTVLGLAVIGGSLAAYKAYLKSRIEEKNIDAQDKSRIEATQQETARMKILADALAQKPELQNISRDFDDVRSEFLSSSADATTISMQGLPLSSATARKIASTNRAESQAAQLNGSYRIMRIDWSNEGRAKIRVSGEGREFVADLNVIGLALEKLDILQDAEWNQKTLYLSVNANMLRDVVTGAAIVDVAWPAS